MTVEYRMTEDDYVEAMGLHQRRHLRRLIIILAVFVVVLITSRPWMPPDIAWSVPIGCVAMSAALAAVLIAAPYTARRAYRNYPAIHATIAVELADDELRFGSTFGETRLPWQLIFKWHQSDRLVLIYIMPALFYVIPKSLAQQGFDLPGLLRRLAERVGPERS